MGNAPAKAAYPKSLAGAGNGGKKVHWSSPGLPLPPGKPILVPGSEETQPDVVSIRWERSPSNGGSAIVGYMVEHRRMGSPHWIRAAPILCTFPELTLSGLEPGWRYQFRVRAQNALGLSEPSELSDPLTVTLQRTATSTPHFDLELKDTVALENEQAEFIVQFSGTPLPKISWFKDGFEIFSSRRTRIATENSKSSLLIHQTALNDEGEIKCTATNRVGHISTKAKLILEAPPRIRLSRQYEDGLLFEQDETIRLKVSLAGRPLPSVTWFHDGEAIQQDLRHVVETMEGESVLKIPDAKRADRGEYTVKASNKLGEDMSSFLVTVTDRPSAPGKANVTMTLGRSVTLSWKEPDDDGGCKIGTYIVEYYRLGWDVWLKATTCRQLTTTLGELIEGSEYRFRVKAENPYGVSEPSEESDVVFIPDVKRGITEPPLKGKSQSQREINKTKEKREVSFAEPVQRTRSLTREEASRGDRNPSPEWTSTQQLSSGRLSRADDPAFARRAGSRPKPKPDPPLKAKRLSKQERIDTGDNLTLPKDTETLATLNVSNSRGNLNFGKQKTLEPVLGGRRSPFRDSRSRSVSRERSPSPLLMPKIQESHEELLAATPHSTSSNLVLQKQKTFDSLPDTRPLKVGLRKQNTVDNILMSPSSPRENDESMFHGSSEFMLVLYPDENNHRSQEQNNAASIKEGQQVNMEAEEDDLVPPPLSLSLPELFSASHEVVETLREAVSSTELLHERAMERFYHAVAVEEAELAKRKAQTERRTGELAGLTGNASQKGEVKIRINSLEAIDGSSPERRASLRRKLSNSGVTSQIAWQAKRNRRRSSEGQTDTPATVNTRTNVLLDASSDPNLPTTIFVAGIPDQTERLHRWDSKNMPLTVEISEVPEADVSEKEFYRDGKVVKEDEVRSVETSEDEEVEEEESSDSEDLKLLKARILAQPIIDEEDTYHPKGRPVQHISPDLPPVPPHMIPILDISSSVPTRPVSLPSSPTNLMPKSILKKRTETEVIPLNQFGRPVPPEKPIRKSLQPEESQVQQAPQQQTVTLRKKSLTSIPDEVKGAAISESDIDNSNVLSAAEVARNRRRQVRQTSLEEEAEANMAVVSHYTEIVKQHSSGQTVHPPLYLKREDLVKAALVGENEPPVVQSETKVLLKANGTLRDMAAMGDVTKKSRSNLPDKTEAPTTKREAVKDARKSADREDGGKVRRNSVVSRGSTPAKDTKETTKRESRPSSRNESLAGVPRSRNVSRERRPSRPSSRTESRGVSQEKSVPQRGRVPSRTTSEDIRSSRDKSLEKRKSSRPNSRSSSRDRFRPETPTEVKMGRLYQALGSRKYRPTRQYSDTVAELNADAERKVKSTMSYVTDLTLLAAAIYVYFLKSEILALPFIGLLLYRQIQEEIHRWLPKWWKHRE
ncbi:uncharacterized protein LOC124298633 [Neodiprion virginianus]|uniref:uncharacterized protein LOC124298633 n=1 Tax=Neodiprion virginianus TaxID=2961670 RepID=UPI001EE6DAA9|nr:uncharacterized protein LOC124298633 [Neodiprion virginianus]